jgi:poly [ADP-ribose] polymerase
MFGKGIYFTDMISKSANYCFATKEHSVGLMLLCDVALGAINDKFRADYNAANLPLGKHSTRGVGKTAPPEDSYIDLNGVTVPIGKAQPTKFQNVFP